MGPRGDWLIRIDVAVIELLVYCVLLPCLFSLQYNVFQNQVRICWGFSCILFTVYCILYIVYCILYTVYCILYTVYCILYTVIIY